MSSDRERWVPWVSHGGVVVVGTTAATMSFLWLSRLAELVGINHPMSLSLPITVDVGGAVATVLWMRGRKDVRGWAQSIAVGCLILTVVGNAVAHLIELHMLQVSAVLVVTVGAVYPTMTWLLVHLLTVARRETAATVTIPAPPKQQPLAEATPRPRPAPERPAAPVRRLHPVKPAEQTTTKLHAAYNWFTSQVVAGRDPATITAAEVDRAIGASGYAKKHIQEWRATAARRTVNEQ